MPLPCVSVTHTSHTQASNSLHPYVIAQATQPPFVLRSVLLPPLPLLEERVYRHRCVEAWAIVVPWIGFPLRKLLATVQPLPGARYVRFETDAGKYMPNAQGANLGPGTPNWPYVEGLTLQEAMNDLAFVSIGQFNATLLAQSGAPIRMNVSWEEAGGGEEKNTHTAKTGGGLCIHVDVHAWMCL